MTATNTNDSKTALLAMNAAWLDQAAALLREMDDETYSASPKCVSPHRVGGHLRHILEFYECFLNGIQGCIVDYDARRRDLAIERSRTVALSTIENLRDRLSGLTNIDQDHRLRVRMEDAEGSGVTHDLLESSVGRELQVLSSHTIHHFALIAFTLRVLGFSVDRSFGMAPSTLRYQAKAEAA
jgi:hypothetical protein